MAPKQNDEIEKNPTVVSSSEEEEEEDDEDSGSSGEETDSSSDEDNVQTKLTQTSVASVSANKPDSESEEEESESESSDSDSKLVRKKPLNTVVAKPRPETSGSTGKRSLTDVDEVSKKKMKTEHVEKTSTTDEEEESESESTGSDSEPVTKKPPNSAVTKTRPETSGSTGKRALTKVDEESRKKMKTEHVKKPSTADGEEESESESSDSDSEPATKRPPNSGVAKPRPETSGSTGKRALTKGDEKSKKKMKTEHVKKPSTTDEEEESESESSDSDSELATKKPLNTVVAKPRPETSGSTGKLALTKVDEGSKKKMKTEHVKKPSTTDEEVKKVSGDEPKKLFQRLFSETDEIAMLQGFLDFNSTRGNPYENMDSFCDYVKTLIEFNATKVQIVTKLQRCKKKFVNMVMNSLKKGKNEDEIKYSKDFDQKAFELSRKIWGVEGLLTAEKIKILFPSPAHKKEEEEINYVVNTRPSGREMARFFKADNASASALDATTIIKDWGRVADGPKKREMEEKFKKLKATMRKLCLQRIGLVNNTAKMLFKKNASSSST